MVQHSPLFFLHQETTKTYPQNCNTIWKDLSNGTLLKIIILKATFYKDNQISFWENII